MQGWDEVKKNAGLNLRSWALHSEGLRSTDFRDTWGWEQLGQDDIQGLIRVNQNKADQLLKISGVNHGGIRWYLEPLQWAAPLLQTTPPAVDWIDSDNLGAAAKTACEAARCHGLGVVLGRRRVGVRKPRSAAEASTANHPRRRVWKFLGVPHDMFEEDVVKMVEQGGFASVEVLDCFRWRKTKGWTVRATRSDSTSHLELQAGDAKIRVDRRVHHALPSERRVTFAESAKLLPPKGSFSRFPHGAKAGFGVAKPAPMEVEGTKPEGTEGATTPA